MANFKLEICNDQSASGRRGVADFSQRLAKRQRDCDRPLRAKRRYTHPAGSRSARGTDARKKSSQKSTRPRGAKDAVTFPGAIGRNNACVRADLQQVALGGEEATAARRGVYRSGWAASVPTPTAAGSTGPYPGGRPVHVVC